jgi:hypothetical protein|tara:strand:+ start:339 stop:572 length:234 start_codon:yes stop_codon:yes gene_type:complete
MIDSYRYDSTDLAERRFALAAITQSHIPIDAKVYEFCDSFTRSGKAKELIRKYVYEGGDTIAAFREIVEIYREHLDA